MVNESNILKILFPAGMIGSSIGMRGDGFAEVPCEVFAKTITILFSTEDASGIILSQGSGQEKFEILGNIASKIKITLDFLRHCKPTHDIFKRHS